MLLNKYVPDFISSSKLFTTLYDVQQNEVDGVNNAIQDIINQCFIDTATWGLDYWESFLGIKTDKDKDINYRRSVIKAKLRGQGTVTTLLIKNVADSFSNADVSITEDPENYGFEIKFNSVIGVPPNLEDLKAAIEQIKPAHLSVTYAYKYLLINQIHNVLTIDKMQSHKLTDFAPFIPV